MKIRCKYALLCAVLLLFGCQRVPEIDALGRSKADGMNREAFLSRYRDPQRCITLSDSALRFLQDSLPHYVDGQLRACNNKAFAYFLTSDYPNASLMLDHVDKLVALRNPAMRNGDTAVRYGPMQPVMSRSKCKFLLRLVLENTGWD